MKREERLSRLNGLRDFARVEALRIYGDAKKPDWDYALEMTADAIAITETLAEVERYRTLLVKYEASLGEGRTDDLLKRIVAARGHENRMAAWALEMRAALADEEVKPDDSLRR